ncbi:phage holin family protein [Lichenihabitans sp. Uapishka_5]|uniref:phage holin family protein n=1 Tax=Lichenihabitans sp. Uapishka_5 TaxID=3037302 RepID=UPI0029E7CDAE|nr:phage holin family protein [Lichenihabitans sp. Uapishka_5]MDX7953347.1 phage holin family protein [Lichenihabitans sp. Uapishka_5]
MNEAQGRPSTSSLVADAMAQMARLVETEIRLVRTELGEKVTAAVKAVAIIAAAAVLMLTSIVLLLIGCVHLLIYFGLQAFVAYFAVAILFLIIGGVSVYFAISHLTASGLVPKRSLRQIGKDARAIKEQVS